MGGDLALYFGRAIAGAVIMATVLPLVQSPRWWFRIFDYPRTQVAVLGLVCVGFAAAVFPELQTGDRILAALVGVSIIAQIIQIYPYTRIAGEQVIRAKAEGKGNELKLFTCNVLQDNHRTSEVLRLVDETEPDIVLLTEIDAWWEEKVASLEKKFPYVLRCPLSNYYGMMLYSRLKLTNTHIDFLVQSDIPSMRADVTLGCGQVIHFYGVHPRPPGSKTDDGTLRGSGARDTELVLIAREIQKHEGPTVVAGDFNDVAWSHTTRLFQRLGRLLDPRVGRGFFNTFPAHAPFLRYPLDHLFHSEHFALVEFRRLPSVGSDHFPIYASIKYKPSAAAIQHPPEPVDDDKIEAQKILHEAPKE